MTTPTTTDVQFSNTETISKDLLPYIKPEVAIKVPYSVAQDLNEVLPYALELLFEIPTGFNSFAHIEDLKHQPNDIYKAFVICDKKLEGAISALDEITTEDETLLEALFLLKNMNEMLREVRIRMASILCA